MLFNFLRITLLLIVFVISFSYFSQTTLTVRIDSGNSTTSCTDGAFGGGPEAHWRVEIAGQGYTTYPQAGICYNNAPYTQYSETFTCLSAYPANLQICLRAFEDDGTACVVMETCLEQTCQNFATPAPGASLSYTLSVGGASTGTVNFTITASGSPLGLQGNDLICNAVDLGTLNSGSTVGNSGLSNNDNFCASNAGDPNPWGGNNDQGVWFKFTTGPSPASTINIDANSDPQGLGNDIDLQMALYQSSNGLCSGTLTLVEEEYQGLGQIYDEEMTVTCLLPNTNYYLLVDGENTAILNTVGQEGYFGLQITDTGILQAGDLVCNAENLGIVPDGGSVGTPLLSRTNICATNTNDPLPSAWGADQSVWFKFQAPTSGSVLIDANSDLPFPSGTDAVDIQLAVYETNTGICTGTLNHLKSTYDPSLLNEDLIITNLTLGQNYWVMLDGSATNTAGVFDLSIIDAGGFLAATLLDFSGKQLDQNNLLSWSTLTEVNNNYFTIKRSLDGTNYETIGVHKGSGNSSTLKKYSFFDEQPSEALTYYQLFQTDFDGKLSNLGIITVANDLTADGLRIIPNPVNQNPQVIISCSSTEIGVLEITEIKGARISLAYITLKEGVNEHSFDTSNLKPGLYFLSLTTNKKKRTIKFVKQ